MTAFGRYLRDSLPPAIARVYAGIFSASRPGNERADSPRLRATGMANRKLRLPQRGISCGMAAQKNFSQYTKGTDNVPNQIRN